MGAAEPVHLVRSDCREGCRGHQCWRKRHDRWSTGRGWTQRYLRIGSNGESGHYFTDRFMLQLKRP